MEDLLKAYAKKRQAEAGKAQELHPATRRLLQAEVARLRSTHRPRVENWFSSLLRFWPRVAFAGATLAVIGLVAWGLLGSGKERARTTYLAKREAVADHAQRALDEQPALQQRAERPVELKRLAPPATADRVNDSVRMLSATSSHPASAFDERLAERNYTLEVPALSKSKSATAPQNESEALLRAPSLLDQSLVSKQETRSDSPLTLSILPQPGQPLEQSRVREAFGLATNGLASSYLANSSSGIGVLRDGGAVESNLARFKGVQAGATPQGAVRSTLAVEPVALNGEKTNPDVNTAASKPGSPLVDSLTAARNSSAAGVAGPGELILSRSEDKKTDAAYFGKESSTFVRRRFEQVQQVPQSTARQQPNGAATTVLATFEIEQAGQRLRVVDADGSVYDGELLGNVVAGAGARPVTVLRETVEKNQKLGDTVAPAAETAAAPAPWNFRVSGTNRTLQQPVVLEGVLLSTAQESDMAVRKDAQQPAPVTSAGNAPQSRSRAMAAPAQYPALNQNQAVPTTSLATSLLPAQRIQGKVRIGTSEQSLDAVRVQK
jgi:hypothetical protein